MSAILSKSDFIHEVEHLRSWGMPAPEMAERLGMTLESFRNRLRRCGISADTPSEARTRKAVHEIVGRGVPFTTDDLPGWCDPAVLSGEVQALARAGRIVKIGTRNSATTSSIKPLFQAAEHLEEAV